jgi:hypothetical protein
VDTQTRLESKNLGLSRFPITSLLKKVLHCKFIVELAFQHSGIWVNFINFLNRLCAGITTFLPFKHHNLGPQHRVGILGIGGLGHLAVRLKYIG